MTNLRLSWRKFQSVVLAAGFFSGWSGIAAQSTKLAQSSVNVTLCAVRVSPEKFNNRLVTISAQYESDGMEREGLSDASCGGIALRIPSNARGTEQLRLALRRGYAGTVDKKVKGTFTGFFRWNPDNHPPGSLDVQSIDNVTVENRK
jgi:hypothetical protein